MSCCCNCETKEIKNSTDDSNNYDLDNSKNNSIIPLYTKKDKFRCLFCGGKSCKHEDYTQHPNSAIEGLNSDQIDENIFASQRPSNVLIERYKLIQKFKEKNIQLIVNLQRPGEHPYCGPNEGLDELSGFTYSPSIFTSNGVDVLLVGWKDMTCPESLSFMLNIVKKMDYVISIKKAKVLVHCHAGYGRTGIAIACYKMFKEHVNAETAVNEIRTKRPNCIQKSEQMDYCNNFYQYLYRITKIFGKHKKNIHYYIQNQNDLHVDNNSNKLESENFNQYVPLLIFKTLKCIVNLKDKHNIETCLILDALNGCYSKTEEEIKNKMKPIIENINLGKWEILENYEDTALLAELLYKWLKDHVNPCINEDNLDNIFKDQDFNIDKVDQENYNKIKDYLYIYEFEIIEYISKFFNQITQQIPTLNLNEENKEDNQSNKEDLDLVIKKFSRLLLAIPENETKISNVENYLIKIFNFLCEYHKIKFNETVNAFSSNTSLINKNLCNTMPIRLDNLLKKTNTFGKISLIQIAQNVANNNKKNQYTSRTMTNRTALVKRNTTTLVLQPWIIEEDC